MSPSVHTLKQACNVQLMLIISCPLNSFMFKIWHLGGHRPQFMSSLSKVKDLTRLIPSLHQHLMIGNWYRQRFGGLNNILILFSYPLIGKNLGLCSFHFVVLAVIVFIVVCFILFRFFFSRSFQLIFAYIFKTFQSFGLVSCGQKLPKREQINGYIGVKFKKLPYRNHLHKEGQWPRCRNITSMNIFIVMILQ